MLDTFTGIGVATPKCNCGMTNSQDKECKNCNGKKARLRYIGESYKCGECDRNVDFESQDKTSNIKFGYSKEPYILILADSPLSKILENNVEASKQLERLIGKYKKYLLTEKEKEIIEILMDYQVEHKPMSDDEMGEIIGVIRGKK